jgi:hypothetical protein
VTVFDSFVTPWKTETPTIELTSQQMALILALERVLQAAGLWLVCPICANELGTYKHLVTNNHPTDDVWKIDCQCTHRSFRRAALETSMIPSGDLLTVATILLPPARLAVRCPNKISHCLTTDLQLTQRPDGVTARCRCWELELGSGTYTFTKKQTLPS